MGLRICRSAYAAGYVELFAVDLRRTYEYYAAEVDLGIGQALENQGLSPVMAGHFLGSGADAGEGMHSAVQYLKRIADYGDVAQVYVRLAAQHADRLHGEEQIVVHSALTHDLLDDNHLLLVGMTLLLKGLGGDNQTLVQLLQSNADLLGDDVGSVMCCQRARTGHIGLFLDGHLSLDEDLTLLRTAGTAPHDVLIEDTLGGTELTDLYAVIIGTGQHHYDAVQNAGNACAQYIVAFLGGDGLYVHYGLGIGVILSGSYDVDLQIVYQLLRIYALLLNAFADVKGGALYLGLGTALYFGDLKVLAGEGADNLLLYLFLCGSG